MNIEPWGFQATSYLIMSGAKFGNLRRSQTLFDDNSVGLINRLHYSLDRLPTNDTLPATSPQLSLNGTQILST